MTAQNGKDLLVKIDMDGVGDYETLAGLRATRVSFNTQTIDTTSLESTDGWRELLVGGGVKTLAITGSGVFRDAASDARAREIFFAGDIPNFQIIIPDFGVFQGMFQISSIEYAGNYDGEATYEVSLASAGAISFVAD